MQHIQLYFSFVTDLCNATSQPFVKHSIDQLNIKAI